MDRTWTVVEVFELPEDVPRRGGAAATAGGGGGGKGGVLLLPHELAGEVSGWRTVSFRG